MNPNKARFGYFLQQPSSTPVTLQARLQESSMFCLTLPSGVLAARLSFLFWIALELTGFKGVRLSGPSVTAPPCLGLSIWPMLLLLCCSATLCAWSTALRAEFRIAAVVSVCCRLFWRGLINTERLGFRVLVCGTMFCGSQARVWHLLIFICPIAAETGIMLEPVENSSKETNS